MKAMVRIAYLLLAVSLLVLPGISQATTIYQGSLTDSYSGTYTLLVTDDGDANPNTYHATITVDTNVVSDAYIDWFLVHFDTPAADITGAITATTGTWVEGDGVTPIYGYPNNPGFPTGPFTGGYETGLDDNPAILTGGFLLSGNIYNWEFDFTSAAPILGEGGDSNPNLQVGFYGSGVDGFPRLSQDFSVVPEPATLVLLGSGVLGLPLLRRKFRR